jgi:hypothetical protein
MLIFRYAPESFSEEELLKRAGQQIKVDQGLFDTATEYKHVFTQPEVKERNPDFAARELLDEYRKRLSGMASSFPTRYSGVIAIDARQYDHGRQMLHKQGDSAHLLRQPMASDVTGVDDRILYDLKSLPTITGNLDTQLRDKFGYHIYEDLSLVRETPSSMASNVPLPGGGRILLALNQILEIPAFPLKSADAEKQLTSPQWPNMERADDPAKKKFYREMKEYLGAFLLSLDFEIKSVLARDRDYVIVADLLGARLLGTRGELLQTYAASDFPSAAEFHAKLKKKQEDQHAAIEAEQRKEAEARAREQSREQATDQAEKARLAETREALRKADIAGIRLGMTIPEAEQVIRQHMEVGWVAELSEDNLLKLHAAQWTNHPYGHFRTYIRADGAEQITLFWHPKVSERLIAVTRLLPIPEGTSTDAMQAQLMAKYGDQLALSQKSRWVWTVDYGAHKSPPPKGMGADLLFRNGSCESRLRGAFRSRDLRTVTGENLYDLLLQQDRNMLNRIDLPTVIDVDGGRQAKRPGDSGGATWDPSQWRECGPTVLATIDRGREGNILRVGMHDLAASADSYAKVFEKPSGKAVELDL